MLNIDKQGRSIGLLLLACAAATSNSTARAQRVELDAATAAVVAKNSLQGIDDAERIERQVRAVADQLLPATVGLLRDESKTQGFIVNGSGVVVNRDGLILTVGHVVGQAGRKISVILSDGRELPGITLGANHDTDSGMVKLVTPPADLKYCPVVEAGEVPVGSWVMAAGHPGEVVRDRTPPIRLGRAFYSRQNLLCTDCKIIPGDSGGPLVNLNGEVVGIHSIIGEKLDQNFHVSMSVFRRDWKRMLDGEVWGGPDRIPVASPATPDATGPESARKASVQPADSAVRRSSFNPNSYIVADWVKTNAAQVRAAFRASVDKIRQSTVCISCDGRDVAFGAIVRSNGWIVTKHSVLAEKPDCRLSDQQRFPARIVAFDKEYDVALLKIEVENLVPVEFASAIPPIGSWLLTIGLERDPMAVGIVSVLPRAIPHEKGFLGVNLKFDSPNPPSVGNVLAGSGADEAGIRVGDGIAKINGEPIHDRRDFDKLVAKFSPADKIELEILRENDSLRIEAIVKNSESSNPASARQYQIEKATAGPMSIRRFGFPKALQHDTPLRPDQCGGPLTNLQGKCIGLNIARSGRTESYAVSADTVQRIADRLIANADAL